MEIKISSEFILKGLQLISWVVFIGLCIHSGSLLFAMVYALIGNPNAAVYYELDHVLQTDNSHFITLMSIMIIVAVLKTILFYCIIKVFIKKHLNVNYPFTEAFFSFINNMAWLALGIGLFSYWGSGYLKKLSLLNLPIPNEQTVHIAGADVWIFMAIILLVLAQLFKKGVAMQHENEYTI